MKLIIAIINEEDAGGVTGALTQSGFSSTKMVSTGGFLRAGNVTILVGVDEEKVEEAIGVIRGECHPRRRAVPEERPQGGTPPFLPEVTVGGATMFVVDIEHFERV